MIYDLKQPVIDWISDVLTNFSDLMGDGEDPSFTIIIDGIEIEIRLNKIPGEFDRSKTIIDK